MNAGRRLEALAAACAFVLAAPAAYANVLDSFFLSDDFAQIGKVLAGDLSATWGRERGGFFRPLFVLSYAADASLWGRRAFGFHLTNAALHGLNSFLVSILYLALRDAGGVPGDDRRSRLLAAAAGLVFLLHPSHTEAVSWISGRADLLSTLFCLLSLLCFVRYARTNRLAPLAASVLLFAPALLAKESAICLPLVVLAAGMYLARRSTRGARAALTTRGVLRATLCFVAVLGAYLAARFAALGALVGGYGAEHHLYFTHGVFASQTLRYTLRATLPANALRAIPFLESRALSPALIATGAALVLASAFFLRRAKSRRAFAAWAGRHAFLWLLLLLFGLCLLPAINLRVNVYDTQGERYLYLASAFSSAALAHALAGTRKARLGADALRLAALSALLIFYGVTLWQTNRVWREAGRLSAVVLEDLTRLSTRDAVLVLNAPDNLRGAHLFRNGLGQALTTFQDEKKIGRVEAIAFHAVESAGDALGVKGEGGGVVSLRLSNPKTTFERVNAPPECAHILTRSPDTLRFDLRRCAKEFDVFFYSAGRAHKLNGG